MIEIFKREELSRLFIVNNTGFEEYTTANRTKCNCYNLFFDDLRTMLARQINHVFLVSSIERLITFSNLILFRNYPPKFSLIF